MKLFDKSRLQGEVKLVLRGPDGKVKQIVKRNTVTAAGKAASADKHLTTPTLGKPTHIAVGTGTPGANALGAELLRKALATKTLSVNVLTMTVSFAPGEATGALTEAGTFDASSAGNAFLTASFAVINKAAGDTLDVTWTWTFG